MSDRPETAILGKAAQRHTLAPEWFDETGRFRNEVPLYPSTTHHHDIANDGTVMVRDAEGRLDNPWDDDALVGPKGRRRFFGGRPMEESEHRAIVWQEPTHRIVWHNPATGHKGIGQSLPEEQAAELVRRLDIRYPGIEHRMAEIAPTLRNAIEEAPALPGPR